MIRLFEEPLKPVSRPALVAWLVFYCAFLIYAARDTAGFLFIDHVNLVMHEAGHPLFSYLGQWMGVLGGTLLQWAVPLMLAAGFYFRRETAGFVFCLFFFFENWLYTATYMADARAQNLPLVSIGGGDDAIHDWNYLFTSMGCLASDTKIASVVRACGWLGMLATVLWLVWFGLRRRQESE